METFHARYAHMVKGSFHGVFPLNTAYPAMHIYIYINIYIYIEFCVNDSVERKATVSEKTFLKKR